MELILQYFQVILPELFLVCLLVLLVLVDLILKEKKALLITLTFAGVLVELYLVTHQYFDTTQPVSGFFNLILLNSYSAFWKMLLSVSTLIVILILTINKEQKRLAEFLTLILTILIGSNLLIMSSNLLMIFLSVEIISIASYIITTFAFNRASAESGLKYLLFGAAASAVMLYGMSLLYAQTLTLEYPSQQFLDALLEAEALPVIVSFILVLAGLFFKIAAFPFHIWAPDIYTSAPTSAVAYFSVVPKLAGFAILTKVVLVFNLFGQAPINWITFLSIVAMITLTVGNFSAIWQSNVKRMLAYSSIAHTGFLLAGFAAFSETALQHVLFYASVYLIMNLGAFLLVHYFEVKHNFTKVEDYKGLINTYPFLSIIFLIFMISLAGLPPTGGFTAKYLVFSSIWDSYNTTENQWLIYLLIFGLVNTVISLFYYLKIPFYMIFRSGADGGVVYKNNLSLENFLGGLLVLAILLIFFKPDWLMGMINSVSFAF
ncbi:NADH-quinone oxidoreductase subunit N [Fulvivirga sp.]|uniref:NADH-quinone oxidoreductase subunit N n=1 Tax=Fulvivirga sp. TaxID=1931237 RepID=UPI0032ED942F